MTPDSSDVVGAFRGVANDMTQEHILFCLCLMSKLISTKLVEM